MTRRSRRDVNLSEIATRLGTPARHCVSPGSSISAAIDLSARIMARFSLWLAAATSTREPLLLASAGPRCFCASCVKPLREGDGSAPLRDAQRFHALSDAVRPPDRSRLRLAEVVQRLRRAPSEFEIGRESAGV